MCLHIHAKFRGDRPLRGRDLKGEIDPPPSKNLVSKSPVKIGLKLIFFINQSSLKMMVNVIVQTKQKFQIAWIRKHRIQAAENHYTKAIAWILLGSCSVLIWGCKRKNLVIPITNRASCINHMSSPALKLGWKFVFQQKSSRCWYHWLVSVHINCEVSLNSSEAWLSPFWASPIKV